MQVQKEALKEWNHVERGRERGEMYGVTERETTKLISKA